MPKIIYYLLILLTFCNCSGKESYHSVDGMVWNTTYHIVYNGDETLADSILPALDRVSQSVSVFDKNSIVANVNSQKSAKVDSIFIKVYTESVRINRETAGAFDPTVSPLITAWGFGKDKRPTADTLNIESLLERVGIDKTSLSGDTLVKDNKNIEFNFSAIAKGYGCDAVAEMFMRNGVEDFMIEIGGEIRAGGKSPRGTEWKIAIDAPIESRDSIVHEQKLAIVFTDAGVATSGNYRNYHEDNGAKFGHTIDPKSGRPVKTDVLSATVVAENAMDADAYATALMVLGSEKGLELAQRLDLAILLILNDDRCVSTEKFKQLIISK